MLRKFDHGAGVSHAQIIVNIDEKWRRLEDRYRVHLNMLGMICVLPVMRGLL